MATGTIKRTLPLFLCLLASALGSACTSRVEAPWTSDLVVSSGRIAPSLDLASYTANKPAVSANDDKEWRVVKKRKSSEHYHNPGLNLSLKTVLSDVQGDLNGNTAFSNAAADQFVFVPDVDASAGIGFDVGMRWERFEMLLAFQETEYDASFGGAGKDTTIRYIDLLFREYFWIDSHLQPFLVAGMGVSEAEIEGGAQDAGLNLSTGELLDGININVGGGLAFYANPRLSFFGQLLYRFGRYETVNGSFGKLTAPSTIDSDGWELSLGVSFNVLNAWN